MAISLAKGTQVLTEYDLIWLGIEIETYNLKPEFLPGPKTISGKPGERKTEIFRLAKDLWGIEPEVWLTMENNWLKSARAKSGSLLTTGKDDLDEVISAELLIRILATTKYLFSPERNNLVKNAAVNAINLAINEAVIKGRTRISRVGEKSVYSILKDHGIMIGSGGGKYLPDPETSLPELFLMFTRKQINLSAYLR